MRMQSVFHSGVVLCRGALHRGGFCMGVLLAREAQECFLVHHGSGGVLRIRSGVFCFVFYSGVVFAGGVILTGYTGSKSIDFINQLSNAMLRYPTVLFFGSCTMLYYAGFVQHVSFCHH